MLFADRRTCEHRLKGLGLSRTCTFRRITTVGTSATEATRNYFVCGKNSSETLLDTTFFWLSGERLFSELLMTLITRTVLRFSDSSESRWC